MRKLIDKYGKRWTALLIIAVILFTMQRMPVLADTAERNVNTTNGRVLPSNPVHNCTKQNDGTDTTDWDYVYFGSYPQSEVTEDALDETITEAVYDANGDAWINGTKYHRISKSQAGSSVNFGDSTYRYFKWERIKWRVLQNDGSTLFVMADTGIDRASYGGVNKSSWESSSIRNWLNNNFYSTAFNSEEQGIIVPQTVVNKNDNPYYKTDDGKDTTDKIYLLSCSEVSNPDYGFCEDGYTHSVSRIVKASDYAYIRGAYTIDGSCWWWLRTLGEYDIDEWLRYSTTAVVVDTDGNLNYSGYSVNISSRSCVPVLHIDCSSDFWYRTDDGTSGSGGEDPDPERELAELKNRLKEELESYKNASDYRETQQMELAEAVSAGKAAIEEAADEAGANHALADAKEVIDRIKTDMQLTKEEKETALQALKEKNKKELESYKNASDYREAQQMELLKAIASGKAAIEAATDESGVNHALAEAKEVIDQIKTDAQLTEEERIEAETALASVKAERKEELESYKNVSDYREAQQVKLTEAIASGKAAIEAATDEAGVNRALAEAKAEIDQIKTDAQLTEEEREEAEAALASVKAKRKEELESYKNASDYREAQQMEFAEVIASGKAAIEAATDEAGVNRALAKAKAEIDQIKTDIQLTEEEKEVVARALKAMKEKSKEGLESYKSTSDYREAQQAELAEIIASGKAAIEAAADETEVNRALAEAKAEIDQIKTDAQLTKEERIEAEAALASVKVERKEELANYKNASDYRKAQQVELSEAIASGKAAIEAATDEAGVNRVLAEAKKVIDQIKTDAQLTEEERIEAEAALASVKAERKEELANYKNASDYRKAQQVELTKAIASGKAAIEAATDEAGANYALAEAKAEIDQIKTDAQLTEEERIEAEAALASVKTERKEELESYKNASDYREAQQIELSEVIVSGKAAIEAATDEAGVNRAFTEAKAAIDQIKTDAQLIEEEKKTLRAALTDKLEEYKELYEGNGVDYTTTTWERFKEAYEAVQAELEAESKEKEELENLLAELNEARAGLANTIPDPIVDPEVEVLITELEEKLNEYQTEFSGTGENYTPESWKRFQTAYLAVQNAYKNNVQDKDILEKLLKELNESKAALKEAVSTPPTLPGKDLETAKTQLNTILSNYKDLYLKEKGNYTDASWQQFSTAYNNAQKALSWGVTDTAVLTVLKNQLKDAYRKLIQKPANEQILAAPAIASVKFAAEKKKLGVKITIKKVANAASYTIYRTVKGTVKKIGTTDASGVIYDANPASGKQMSYYAVANPSSASYQESSKGRAKSITLTAPVKKITVKQIKKKPQVKLSWKKVKNAKQYIIYRSTKKNSGYTKVKTLKNNKLTYTDKKVKKGKKYYYKIVVKTKKGYSGIKTSKVVKIRK